MGQIVGSFVPVVDDIARRWLIRLGGHAEVEAGAVVTLRRLVLAGLAGLLAVPAALALFLPSALALPVGAAASLCLFLLALAGFSGLSRPGRGRPLQPDSQARRTPDGGSDHGMAFDEMAFSLCPGMTLVLDAHGRVAKTGGRDIRDFPPALRQCARQMLADIVHVSDRIGLLQTLDALRQGADAGRADIRIELPVSPAGRQFQHLRIDMSAMRDGDGALMAIFAQASDLTQEEAIRASAAAHVAEARSAHEAKSRFLAAVSHELRTPLNAILGFSDVLAGEYFGRLENDRQREYVGLIRQSGAHLLSVVNTMLDMSKIEAGRYELLAEPFMVADAVETCRAMLDLLAGARGVKLTTRTPRGIGELVADRRAVQQILINLAGNAIKFTESGGVVSIDTARDGADLVISVSDTGIGIAEEKLKFIGQPFMQIENGYTRSYEGTGLGLSLVKGLVALHGGSFAIASRPGEGTVVTVRLPADGAGIESRIESGMQGGDGEAAAMVEFPPVLRRAARLRATIDERGLEDEHAQAKIA